jgi:adenylosuccinate synthase
VDPESLVREINQLGQEGISTDGRLYISRQAHCVTPMHRWVESLTHAAEDFGTTRRGIGPAYSDKMARRGFRMEAFESESQLRNALEGAWSHWEVLRKAEESEPPPEAGQGLEAVMDRFMKARERILPLLADTTGLLLEALGRGETILAEGAQGALLDIDHGSYPFVTSSHATSGGACVGLGIPPSAVTEVVGVAKAYATRVGEGPFPTEMDEATASVFRDRAGEYGATTGRPRRCGWLDLVLLRRVLELNGVTTLVMTKLDVLRGMDPLRICTAYDRDGERRAQSEPSLGSLRGIQPVYTEMAGWDEDLSRVSRWEDMAPEAQAYVQRVSGLLGRRVDRVSVGPGREALLGVP